MSVLESPAESPVRNDLAGALRRRYGHHVPDLGAHGNDILAHLLAHRSIRRYRSDPVPPNTVEALVAAAQSAASSSNLQTWSVVAVEDRGVARSRLRPEMTGTHGGRHRGSRRGSSYFM
jgi:hypothetical protein